MAELESGQITACAGCPMSCGRMDDILHYEILYNDNFGIDAPPPVNEEGEPL